MEVTTGVKKCWWTPIGFCDGGVDKDRKRRERQKRGARFRPLAPVPALGVRIRSGCWVDDSPDGRGRAVASPGKMVTRSDKGGLSAGEPGREPIRSRR